MPDTIFRDLVQTTARTFARETRLRSSPDDQAGADHFAARSWQQFIDAALDFLAIRAALAEQEALPVERN